MLAMDVEAAVPILRCFSVVVSGQVEQIGCTLSRRLHAGGSQVGGHQQETGRPGKCLQCLAGLWKVPQYRGGAAQLGSQIDGFGCSSSDLKLSSAI
jgi:hypothetical protein